MKANVRKIKKRRTFTEDFKQKIVKDYEKGIFTVQELSKLYQIHDTVIYGWIYKISVYNEKSIQIVEMKESSTQKIKDLEAKIKELERIVGVKQMNIDFLEKMIEIAKKEYDIDIKKNSSTPQSNGSGSIKNG